jgi:uncharacterized Fe-S cluster-containing MiaB family protein
VVVESHPSLVGERTNRFLDALAGHPPAPALEVAMGLETANPSALERLHKRMTVDGFKRAAGQLATRDVALRVFLLVFPPFVPVQEQDDWLCRSVDLAVAAGATAVSLIPTRTGNGALERLAEEGLFVSPTIHDLERSLALAQRRAPQSTRVFADLWDLQRFADCSHCFAERRARLHAENLEQHPREPVRCAHCQTPLPPAGS